MSLPSTDMDCTKCAFLMYALLENIQEVQAALCLTSLTYFKSGKYWIYDEENNVFRVYEERLGDAKSTMKYLFNKNKSLLDHYYPNE